MVFLGDSGVGKTNIIANFVTGAVGAPPKGPTLGIEYSSKTIPVDARHTVKAQIWDTAGQEQFRSVTTKYPMGYSVSCGRRREHSWCST